MFSSVVIAIVFISFLCEDRTDAFKQVKKYVSFWSQYIVANFVVLYGNVAHLPAVGEFSCSLSGLINGYTALRQQMSFWQMQRYIVFTSHHGNGKRMVRSLCTLWLRHGRYSLRNYLCMGIKVNEESRITCQARKIVTNKDMEEYSSFENRTCIISCIKVSLVNKCDNWHAEIRNWWKTIGTPTGFG